MLGAGVRQHETFIDIDDGMLPTLSHIILTNGSCLRKGRGTQVADKRKNLAAKY